MTTVLGLVWACAVVLASRETWERWGALMLDTIRNPPAFPSGADLVHATGRHSLTVAAVAVLAACSFLAGRGFASFLRAGSAGAVERRCVALGFGWAAVAFLLLGLALTGLFFPPLVLAAVLAAGFAGLRGWRRSLGLAPGRPDRGTFLVFAVAGAPGLLLMFANILPDGFYDTYASHMAAPDHVLKLHRLVTANQHYTINYQLHSELLNALAVILNRDEIAHLISLIPFVAGLGVASAWLARLCGSRTAALAAGLSLDLGGLWWVMLRGKNDPAVAGFCVMALVFAVRRRYALSAACWGIALATKMNAYMLIMPAAALLAWDFRRLPVRGRVAVAAWSALLAAVPAIPWMVRTYLDRGTPFWPILSARFHGTPWEPDAVAALAQYRTGPVHIARSLSSFLPAWLADNPVLLWVLPLAWVNRRAVPAGVRAMTGSAVFIFLFMFGVIHMEYARYTLPVLILLCFACAPMIMDLVARERGAVRQAVLAVVIVLSWSPVAGVLEDGGLTVRDVAGYVSGRTSYGEWLHRLMTTRLEAQRALRSLGDVRSVMLVDEVYAFKWPGRVVTETMPGRAVPWVLTRDASTVERISVRLRQLNVSHMVLNFTSEGHPYNSELYSWTDRQLGLWRDFLRVHARREEVRLPCDVPNGGFCLWRIVRRTEPSGGPLFFLPGIKPLRMWIRRPAADAKDFLGSALRATEMSRRYPDVLVFRHEAGVFFAFAGEWARAYPLLRECADQGMVAEAGLTQLGTAAMKLGKLDEAIRYLEAAERVYIDQYDDIEGRLSEALALSARKMMRERKLDRALELALAAASRSQARPIAVVTLADVRAARGEIAAALEAYLKVAAMLDVPASMRRRADKMIGWCRARP